MLKFKRLRPGVYQANSRTKRYLVVQQQDLWIVEIYELKTTAGVKHTLNQPVLEQDAQSTKREAVAVARAYDELGDDYQPQQLFGKSRMTVAIQNAYAALEEAGR